jgi:tryptophan-rich sensory protein
MGLGQVQWLALYIFSLVLGAPYIIEFVRILVLSQPASRQYEGKTQTYSKGRTWIDHLVFSRRWWDFVRKRVWIATPITVFPFAWVAIMTTYVASIFLTWNRPQNYDEWEYNYLLALVFPHALLTLTWIPSFFRLRSHLWAFLSSLTVALTALSGIIVQGVAKVDSAFYLYLPFLLWWIYLALLSAYVWRDSRIEHREDFAFDDAYDPHEHMGPFENINLSQKHGWEYLQDPTLSLSRETTTRLQPPGPPVY